jgi:hypothetical protein
MDATAPQRGANEMSLRRVCARANRKEKAGAVARNRSQLADCRLAAKFPEIALLTLALRTTHLVNHVVSVY